MRSQVERQTLIALKARRTALHVVHDFVHENRVSRAAAVCQDCGQLIDTVAMGEGATLCEKCLRLEQEHFWENEGRFLRELPLGYCEVCDEIHPFDSWQGRRALTDLLWMFVALPVIVLRVFTL